MSTVLSKYALNLAAALTDALEGVPRAQPAQVAGYWANRDFWLAEFKHLTKVCLEYDARVESMARAYQAWIKKHGGPHGFDSYGGEYQTVRYTTTKGERKNLVGESRAAIKALADRALDLGITTDSEYDAFLEQLRGIRFD